MKAEVSKQVQKSPVESAQSQNGPEDDMMKLKEKESRVAVGRSRTITPGSNIRSRPPPEREAEEGEKKRNKKESRLERSQTASSGGWVQRKGSDTKARTCDISLHRRALIMNNDEGGKPTFVPSKRAVEKDEEQAKETEHEEVKDAKESKGAKEEERVTEIEEKEADGKEHEEGEEEAKEKEELTKEAEHEGKEVKETEHEEGEEEAKKEEQTKETEHKERKEAKETEHEEAEEVAQKDAEHQERKEAKESEHEEGEEETKENEEENEDNLKEEEDTTDESCGRDVPREEEQNEEEEEKGHTRNLGEHLELMRKAQTNAPISIPFDQRLLEQFRVMQKRLSALYQRLDDREMEERIEREKENEGKEKEDAEDESKKADKRRRSSERAWVSRDELEEMKADQEVLQALMLQEMTCYRTMLQLIDNPVDHDVQFFTSRNFADRPVPLFLQRTALQMLSPSSLYGIYGICLSPLWLACVWAPVHSPTEERVLKQAVRPLEQWRP